MGVIDTSTASESSHLNNVLFCYLPVRPFPPNSLEDPYFLFALFRWTFNICATMLSSSLCHKHGKQSKAQSALHSNANTCRPERDNAGNQITSREIACRWAFVHVAAFLKRRNRNRPGKYTIISKRPKLVWYAKDSLVFQITVRCNIPLVFVEHGALGALKFVSLHLKLWITPSASFAFCFVFLWAKRNRGNQPLEFIRKNWWKNPVYSKNTSGGQTQYDRHYASGVGTIASS